MTIKPLPPSLKSFLGWSLLYLAIAVPIFGAPDVAPVPRLGAAPHSSAWTIEYQYKNPNPYLTPPDPSVALLYERLRNQYARIVSIEVVKAGDHKKEIYHLDNQTQLNRWIVGHLLVVEDPQRNTLNCWDAKVPGTPAFTHDFDSLEWVNQATYMGHQSYKQVDCCVYNQKGADDVEQTAYIDANTGLPVAVDQGDVTLVYTFKASSETIELPPTVADQMKAYSGISPSP